MQDFEIEEPGRPSPRDSDRRRLHPRLVVAIVCLGMGFCAAVFFAIILFFALGALPVEAPARLTLWLVGVGGLAALATAAGLAWLFLEQHLARPIATLSRETESAVRTTAHTDFILPRTHALGELPGLVAELAGQLEVVRRDTAKAMVAAAASADAQVARLEAVLRDLSEGVIVADTDHRVVLYNRAALWQMDAAERLGLGRPLFDVVERGAVERALADLIALAEGDSPGEIGGHTVSLECLTVPGGNALEARMALVRDGGPAIEGYVLTIAGRTETEATRDTAALPARPEFYDFELMRPRGGGGLRRLGIARSELRRLRHRNHRAGAL